MSKETMQLLSSSSEIAMLIADLDLEFVAENVED